MTRTATVSLVVLLCLSAPACGSTYVVSPSGGDFSTVQAAVDYAANGDTLLITAGEYVENIVCSGKCLSYYGDGAGVSVLSAAEDSPTVTIENAPWTPGESVFTGLTVLHNEANGRAVVWNQTRATFRHCEIPGELRGGSSSHSYAITTLDDCVVGAVRVWGGYYGTSIITGSDIESAEFTGKYIYDWGASWCEGHSLETDTSVFGSLSLFCDSEIVSTSDEIGILSGNDGCACEATGSSFGAIDFGRGDFELLDCVVTGPVEVDGFAGVSDYAVWDVVIEGTLIHGDLTLDYGAYSDQLIFTIRLAHNTLLGDLTTLFSFSGSPAYVDQYDVMSNIVAGHTSLDGALAWAAHTHVTYNDFIGGFTHAGLAGTIQFNFSLPALFCDAASGDYSLQECSPCAGAAHDGGDVGAFAVGCDCATPVEHVSWGRVKALFRQPSN